MVSLGYNDSAHFLRKYCNRSYYFKKVKQIWTAIDVLTRIGLLSFSYKKDWFSGKAFLQLAAWWQKIHNLNRPHQGLGNLTPCQKLKSLGYVTGEAICLFAIVSIFSFCSVNCYSHRGLVHPSLAWISYSRVSSRLGVFCSG